MNLLSCLALCLATVSHPGTPQRLSEASSLADRTRFESVCKEANRNSDASIPDRLGADANAIAATHLPRMEERERTTTGFATAQDEPTEQTAIRFPEGKRSVEVPFTVDSNHVLIPIRINGSHLVTVALDTGAAGAVLWNGALAKSLNLHIVGEANVRGAGPGPNTRMSLADDVTFDIGGAQVTGNTLAVSSTATSPIGAASRDGTIGRSVFAHAVVEIDWPAHVVRLNDPSEFQYSGKGVVIPLTFDPHGRPYANATVVTEEGRSVPVKLVIDTGASLPLSLDVGSHPDITLPPRTIETTIGRGANGVITGHIGRVKDLQLGKIALTDVLTDFPDASSGIAGVDGRQGILGGEVLRRFKIFFDYSRKRMILEPTAAFREPFEFTMSGIAFRPRNARIEPLKIAQVFEASPAMDAGLRPGDEIVALNGRQVGDFDDDAVRTLFRQNGKTVSVLVRRGSEQWAKRLKLRRII